MMLYFSAVAFAVLFIVTGLLLTVVLQRVPRPTPRHQREITSVTTVLPQRGDLSVLAEGSIEGKCTRV